PTASETDERQYQIRNEQAVQVQNIGEHNTINQYFLAASGSVPAPSSERVWNIPYPRNPVFTGRETILTELASALMASGESRGTAKAEAKLRGESLFGFGDGHIYAFETRHNYQKIVMRFITWCREVQGVHDLVQMDADADE